MEFWWQCCVRDIADVNLFHLNHHHSLLIVEPNLFNLFCRLFPPCAAAHISNFYICGFPKILLFTNESKDMISWDKFDYLPEMFTSMSVGIASKICVRSFIIHRCTNAQSAAATTLPIPLSFPFSMSYVGSGSALILHRWMQADLYLPSIICTSRSHFPPISPLVSHIHPICLQLNIYSEQNPRVAQNLPLIGVWYIHRDNWKYPKTRNISNWPVLSFQQ